MIVQLQIWAALGVAPKVPEAGEYERLVCPMKVEGLLHARLAGLQPATLVEAGERKERPAGGDQRPIGGSPGECLRPGR